MERRTSRFDDSARRGSLPQGRRSFRSGAFGSPKKAMFILSVAETARRRAMTRGTGVISAHNVRAAIEAASMEPLVVFACAPCAITRSTSTGLFRPAAQGARRSQASHTEHRLSRLTVLRFRRGCIPHTGSRRAWQAALCASTDVNQGARVLVECGIRFNCGDDAVPRGPTTFLGCRVFVSQEAARRRLERDRRRRS